jgi:hypothetical protein
MQQRKITCLVKRRVAVDLRNEEPVAFTEGGVEFYLFDGQLVLMLSYGQNNC